MHDAKAFRAQLRAAPVVPVLTIDEVAHAAPLAEALARGGLTTLEVTLRTPQALEAISEMKHAAPRLLVGAGTILSEGDVDAALKAGADFLVSPGVSPALAAVMLDRNTIAIPGVATPTEAMTRYDEGFDLLKLFPATVVGGHALLKAMAAPLPHLDFMPTGGIKESTAPDFLSLPNVVAVGGSWIASSTDMANGDWTGIEARARAAAELGSGAS